MRDLSLPIENNYLYENYMFKEIDKSNSSIFNKLAKSKKKQLTNHMNNNKISIAALNGNNIISYCSISFTTERETWLGININVAKNSAYIYDSNTLKKFKSQGIHSALLSYVLMYLKKQGCETVQAIVGIKNIAAIKCYQKVGFYKIGKIKTYKVFGIMLKRYDRAI